jgi:hypothetical protein
MDQQELESMLKDLESDLVREKHLYQILIKFARQSVHMPMICPITTSLDTSSLELMMTDLAQGLILLTPYY